MPFHSAQSGASPAKTRANSVARPSVLQNAASKCRSVTSSRCTTAWAGPCCMSIWANVTHTSASAITPNSAGGTNAAITNVTTPVTAKLPPVRT